MQSPMIEQATGASLRLRSRTTAVVGGLALLAVVCLYAADGSRPRVLVWVPSNLLLSALRGGSESSKIVSASFCFYDRLGRLCSFH